MSKRRIILALSGLSILLGLGQHEAAAQSTLMNVPSTDVVAAKKVYVEMDFLTNYAWQRKDSFQNYIPRAVVGVARNVEVGANISFTHVSGQQLPIEVQPNVKWQFYSNEGAGTAAAVGCILYAPITHRAGTDTLGQCYVVGSKRVSGRFGPRFTGGGFALLGAGADQQTKGGAIVGYEQPLAKRVSFLVDWFSGDNRFGYVSPGISITTSKTTALTTGYAIANHGRGKNALFIYYGKQF
ncbi:MAG TPA: hypothetical protein DC054_25315 [Blastocatellia bacterium]|nr:hypothetical protein [Blastocatellia bacterium]